MADSSKKEKSKGKGKGKGKGSGQSKVEVPELLKSDDVTGHYKEGSIVTRIDLPNQYQQTFNDAWIVRLYIVSLLLSMECVYNVHIYI